MPQVSKLLVVGLPETGKTTFLAALWHVTESGEVQGSLRLERISGDAKHLNSIKNDWLRCRKLGRTTTAAEQSVSLWLRDELRGATGEVVFPDLSGETFRNQLEHRQWTKEFGILVRDARSVLLFVHPGKINEPYTVADMRRMAQAAFSEEEAEIHAAEQMDNGLEESKAQKAQLQTEEWNPDLAPTQIKLVEILQFLQTALQVAIPVRIAVIISAWDRVTGEFPDPQLAPLVWLNDRLPYLGQYFRSNIEQLAPRAYGVSAQGGDLEADLARLREFDHASERIVIHGLNCSPHDLTEPVRWALGLRTGG